jgi:hypothetical protein
VNGLIIKEKEEEKEEEKDEPDTDLSSVINENV